MQPHPSASRNPALSFCRTFLLAPLIALSVACAGGSGGEGDDADSSSSQAASAPGDLHANATQANLVSLGWQAGSGAMAYHLYRNGELIQTLTADSTTFADFGLSAGTTYTYRLVTVTANGSESAATELNLTTPSAARGTVLNQSSLTTCPPPSATYAGSETVAVIKARFTCANDAIVLTRPAVTGVTPVYDDSAWMSVPLDLSNLRGKQVLFECTLATSDVTTPPADDVGAQCRLSAAAADGSKRVTNLSGTTTAGTTTTATYQRTLSIPADATSVKVSLGLQGATGTVSFSGWKVIALRDIPTRPAQDTSFNGTTTSRGINIQAERAASFYTNGDIATLQSWGANNIRWAMNCAWFSTTGYNACAAANFDAWLDKRLDELENFLGQSTNPGLSIIVDMHCAPGGKLGTGGVDANTNNAVFTSTALQDQYVAAWRKIATRLAKHSSRIYGYDLINEPMHGYTLPAGVLDLYDLQARAAWAIRTIDANTRIIAEVYPTGVFSFATLNPNVFPANTAYSFHVYEPTRYALQGLKWDRTVAADEDPLYDTATYEANYKVSYPTSGIVTKSSLITTLAGARNFQQSWQVPIYVGEFSAMRWAPSADQYLTDLISIFESYGWDWSYWGFRGYHGFNLEVESLPYPGAYALSSSASTSNTRKTAILNGFARNK